MAQVRSKAVKIPISRGREPEEEAGSSVRVAKAKGLYQRQVEDRSLQVSRGRIAEWRSRWGSTQEDVSTAESARKLRSRETQILKRGKWFLQEREERGGADLKRQFPTVRDPKKGVRSLK